MMSIQKHHDAFEWYNESLYKELKSGLEFSSGKLEREEVFSLFAHLFDHA